MNREEMKKLMGMNEGAGGSFYRLDKVTMSGDNGQFKLTDLTSEREKGQKPTETTLGSSVEGVILKMRWVLERWDDPSRIFYSSTEYDDKWKDTITVFPSKDKGSVETLKAKYQLKTLRVIYFYIPEQKKTVRLYVKASALSGKDKNTNGELGLFEYLNGFGDDEALPCAFITICQGVFRAGMNENGTPNKRKDHYAMHFTRGRELNEKEFERVQGLMIEVNEKTNNPKVESEEVGNSNDLNEVFPDDPELEAHLESTPPTKLTPPKSLQRNRSKEEIEEGINLDETPF